MFALWRIGVGSPRPGGGWQNGQRYTARMMTSRCGTTFARRRLALFDDEEPDRIAHDLGSQRRTTTAP